MRPLEVRPPYLLFLADAPDRLAAKTAEQCVRFRPDRCVGQWRLEGCAVDLGLPDLEPEEAGRRGARSVVVGVAHAGGRIPPTWVGALERAARAGLDLVSGMHEPLASRPEIARAAERSGARLVELRRTEPVGPIAKGEARGGLRVLTVGTDCSCGKMLTAWRLAEALAAAGLRARFRATGQTGVLLAGEGVVLDAQKADFVAGFAESLTPPAASDHFDVVEGQGSLHHPSFSGVSLALLHGVRPTHLLLCHDPKRRHLRGLPGRPLPSLEEAIDLVRRAASAAGFEPELVGVALDTSGMATEEVERLRAEVRRRTGLAALDPERHDLAPWVRRLEEAARAGETRVP